jgi:hypothetical protein
VERGIADEPEEQAELPKPMKMFVFSLKKVAIL